MWYRIAQSLFRDASRVLTQPEKTWHTTGNQYAHPIIDTDPDSPMANMGFGGDSFGLGHYTTQNPHVIDGYINDVSPRKKPMVREYKLPIGAKILDIDAIPSDEARGLLAFLRGKTGDRSPTESEYADVRLVTLDRVIGDTWVPRVEVNQLLRQYGYDALEYSAFTKMHVGDEDQRRERQKKGKNVLILNDAMINNPREFTRARLRPDTGEMVPKNSTGELIMGAIERGDLPLDAVTGALLSDPGTARRLKEIASEKMLGGDVEFWDLPEWAKTDKDVVRSALDYKFIGPQDIPESLENDAVFLRGLYDEGILPFWALPESVRTTPEFFDQQKQYKIENPPPETWGYGDEPKPASKIPLRE